MERIIEKLIVLVIVVAAIGSKGLAAQTICNVPISGLLACRAAVTPPNPPLPSKSCCTVLSHADLRCLCSYKNSNLLPSLGIDPKLALQLSSKCKIPLPANC